LTDLRDVMTIALEQARTVEALLAEQLDGAP